MRSSRANARLGCRPANWITFGDESGETGKAENEKQGQKER
jgi:hypothetical protein